jgi:hypothetical protein
MDYQKIRLYSPTHDLDVVSPISRGKIAVIRGLTPTHNFDQFGPILEELEFDRRNKVVFDLSQIPEGKKQPWLAYLNGYAAMGLGLDVRYTGITANDITTDEQTFRSTIIPKIAGSLDTTVESFSK